MSCTTDVLRDPVNDDPAQALIDSLRGALPDCVLDELMELKLDYSLTFALLWMECQQACLDPRKFLEKLIRS